MFESTACFRSRPLPRGYADPNLSCHKHKGIVLVRGGRWWQEREGGSVLNAYSVMGGLVNKTGGSQLRRCRRWVEGSMLFGDGQAKIVRWDRNTRVG